MSMTMIVTLAMGNIIYTLLITTGTEMVIRTYILFHTLIKQKIQGLKGIFHISSDTCDKKGRTYTILTTLTTL